MAMSTEAIRRVTIEATSKGITEATQQLHGLDAAQKGVATSGATTATVTDVQTKRSLSAAEAYRRQTLSVVDGARQQDLLARGIKTATAAYNQGILGEVNSAQAKKALADRISLLNQKYGEASQAATMWHSITERGTQVATSYAGGLGFIGTGLAGLSGGWLAAAAGTGALLVLLKEGTAEAEKDAIMIGRLNAQLNATGNVSGQTALGIEDMALKIARSTNNSKDSVEAAASALLVYDRVGPQVFERTMKAAANMSAVFGGDLASNTSKLGLALDDPIDGMNRLRKSGLDLSVAQKEVITNLEHSGDLLGAQTSLLDALDQRLGGTAAAAHTGLTGSTHDVGVAWDEMLEKLGKTTHIGSAAAGGLDLITAALDHLEKGIDYADKKIQKSPSISQLLGWQNSQLNPVGVVENVAAMAGYGTGDRGLFAPQHGASGSWEPDSTSSDKTLDSTAAAIRAFNVDLKWQASEAGKSPVQQAIDNELKTLATSLHLDVPGLQGLGKKDPSIASAIAETESLARTKAQATAYQKVKETVAGYISQLGEEARLSGLTTEERTREDAIIKGSIISQKARGVAEKDINKSFEFGTKELGEQNVAALALIDHLRIINPLAAKYAEQFRAPLRDYLDHSESIDQNVKNNIYSKQVGDTQKAGLALPSSGRQMMGDLGQTNPFGSSGDAWLQSQTAQIELEKQQRLDLNASLLEAQKNQQDGLLGSQQYYSDQRVNIETAASIKLAQVDTQLYQMRLSQASDFFGNLATLSNSSNKELSAIGKAAAIAQATIQTYLAANEAYAAMASIPYVGPVLGAVAAAAAIAAGIANVAKISGVAGFATGVIDLQGPGTTTSDSILAALSAHESVITAAGTMKNPKTLAAINSGADFDTAATGMASVARFATGVIDLQGSGTFDAASTQRIGIKNLDAIRRGDFGGSVATNNNSTSNTSVNISVDARYAQEGVAEQIEARIVKTVVPAILKASRADNDARFSANLAVASRMPRRRGV